MITWKEFKQWMEKQGVDDDTLLNGMDYSGDFDDAYVVFDESEGKKTAWVGYRPYTSSNPICIPLTKEESADGSRVARTGRVFE